jgi:Skp family chaperone for outer membrane proteins
MSLKHLLTLALGIALLMASSRVRAADNPPTTAPTPMAPLNIGTASIQEIFDALQETQQIKASLDDRQKQLKLQADKMDQDIKNLQADLDVMKQDSPQYTAKSQDIVKAKINLDVFLQTNNADVEHQNKLQLKRVFSEIQEAVRKVAMAEGYDLIIDVVMPDLPPDAAMDSVHPDQLSLLINQRTVLYNDKKHDISRDVIVQMNADFAKSH